jgi:AraC family transcriptional regulator
MQFMRASHSLGSFDGETEDGYYLTIYTGKPSYYRAMADGKHYRNWQKPGDLTIFTTRQKYKVHYDGQENEDIYIKLKSDFFERVSVEAGANISCLELAPRFGIRDPFIERIGHAFQAEIERESISGHLLAENLASELAVHLIRKYSTFSQNLREIKGGLGPRRLRLVIDYINEHLTDNTSLTILASICGLSVYHFARAFKQTTGITPYEYVMRKRVEHAKRLLLRTEMTLAEIAAELNLTDQSHFTKLFRRSTGITPRDFTRLSH